MYKGIKAQVAVENLAILTAFMALLVPAVLLILSLTHDHVKTSSMENAKNSLYRIKWAIEDAYAHCPYIITFPLRVGDEMNAIHIKKEKDVYYLVGNASYGEIYIPLTLKQYEGSIILNEPTSDRQRLSELAKGGFFVYVKCEKIGVGGSTFYYIEVGKVV